MRKTLMLAISAALLVAGGLEAIAQSFTYTGSMASRRALHTATLLDSGEVLVTGGEFKGHSGLNTAEVYNPGTATFSSTGTLNTGRERHTATLLHAANSPYEWHLQPQTAALPAFL